MTMAASDYPLLDVFWTMMVFFGWIIWIWLLITIFADLFSRSDIGGWSKAGWTLLVLVLPFIGVLIYLISQNQAMAERRLAQAQASQAAFDTYVRSVAATAPATSEIEKAKGLLDSGAITQAEFDTIKAKALAG